MNLGTQLTAGLMSLHAKDRSCPSGAQRSKVQGCSQDQSPHLSAATPAVWKQLKQDSATDSKPAPSAQPDTTDPKAGMTDGPKTEPGHDGAASLQTPVMSLSKLVDSLRKDMSNGGPAIPTLPGSEAKPRSSPSDVVELGDSDAELGADEDADLVFLGETSTTLAAARDPKVAAQCKHPGTMAKGLPEDELVLVDSKPGLTPIQLKRRDALTRRKMVRTVLACPCATSPDIPGVSCAQALSSTAIDMFSVQAIKQLLKVPCAA